MQDVTGSEYAAVRQTAWRTLLETGTCMLPADVLAICRREGICTGRTAAAPHVLQLLACGEPDAVAFRIDTQEYLLYDGALGAAELRWALAREAGHCLLGHLEARPGAVACSAGEAALCRQAELFAAELLAPTCLWRRAGTADAEQAAARFGVPPEKAAMLAVAQVLAAQGERQRRAALSPCAPGPAAARQPDDNLASLLRAQMAQGAVTACPR